MGDRRQVIFYEAEEQKPFLYVYCHSFGEELPERVAEAVAYARPRWSDPFYCGRIILSRLTKDAVNSELGWGISGQPLYSEYEEDVHVFLESRAVRVGETYTFEDYVGEFSALSSG
jgi:hypothetical protein